MKPTRLELSLNTQSNDYFNRQRFHLTTNYKKQTDEKSFIKDKSQLIEKK